MSTDGFLNFRNTKRVTFVGPTSNISFDTENSSLGIGVTGPNPPSSNLYITGNAYVTSDFSLGGVLKMGTVNVVARHTLEAITATGNTTSLTTEFTNPTTSLVASGNVEVGGELTVSGNVEVGTANLFVDTVSGRVGVGTSQPTDLLHIMGVGPNSSGNFIGINISDNQGSNSSSNLPAIGFSHNGNIFRGGIQMIGTNTNLEKDMIFRVGRDEDIGGFGVHSLSDVPERMRIKRNGTVGIGTTNPNEKLDIYATGMRIHDPAASPKIDLLRGGPSRAPNTDTFGASNYVDWRITSGPQLKFQQQYTNANSGQILDVMTLHHNSGNVEIPGYLKTGNPAFYAYKSSGNVSQNTIIIYQSTRLNKGSHYNTSNGVFTCPVAGIYTFTWGAIGNDTDTVYRYRFRVNNSNLGDTHLRLDTNASGANYGDGERTITLSLNANDNVRIHYKPDNASTADHGWEYTYFQGHLISYN